MRVDLRALDNTRKRPEHVLQTPLRGIYILNVVNAPCAYFQQLFQQSQLINQITGEARFSPSIVVTATTFKAHSAHLLSSHEHLLKKHLGERAY